MGQNFMRCRKAQPASTIFAGCGHPHAPQMLDGAARTARKLTDQLCILVGQVAKSIIFKRRAMARPCWS